jgi:hypothetical protein
MSTTTKLIDEVRRCYHGYRDSGWHAALAGQLLIGNVLNTGRRRNGQLKLALSEQGLALLDELTAKVPTVPPPSPAAIAEAISIIDHGMWWDTGGTEPAYFDVELFRVSDGKRLIDGIGRTPELAAAAAWVHSWAPDCLDHNAVCFPVPLVVPANEYRFELTEPDANFRMNIKEVLEQRSEDAMVEEALGVTLTGNNITDFRSIWDWLDRKLRDAIGMSAWNVFNVLEVLGLAAQQNTRRLHDDDELVEDDLSANETAGTPPDDDDDDSEWDRVRRLIDLVERFSKTGALHG